jgi:HD-like signal output (HDOD) protein
MTPKPSLQDLMSKKLEIPTIPAVMMKVNSLINDPETGTRDIGAVVAKDAPLAAKVLKIANSAYYGLQGECASTEQATTVLGMRVLKSIVTQAAVMKQFEHLNATEGFDLSALWQHSILVAQLCGEIGRKGTVKLPLSHDELYVCGLLHDVGKIVLLEGLGTEYIEILRKSESEQMPIEVVEARELGFTHTDVGSFVAARWSLPGEVARAIQGHHERLDSIRDQPVIALVACANVMAREVMGGNLAAASSAIDPPTADALGLTSEALDAVVAYAQEHRSDGF